MKNFKKCVSVIAALAILLTMAVTLPVISHAEETRENIALGKPVTATAVGNVNPDANRDFWAPEYLTDGVSPEFTGSEKNLGWYAVWGEEGGEAIVTIDLGTTYLVSEVDLIPQKFLTGQNVPASYRVNLSVDGREWITIGEATGVTGAHVDPIAYAIDPDIYAADGLVARYVRFVAYEYAPATAPYAGLGEIEVYGKQSTESGMPVYSYDKYEGAIYQGIDTIYFDGEMMKNDGAGDYLEQIGREVSDVNVVKIRGWMSVGKEIESFGYMIDGKEYLSADFIAETGADVIAAGGEFASRYEIDIPTGELVGDHEIVAIAGLANGDIVKLDRTKNGTATKYNSTFTFKGPKVVVDYTDENVGAVAMSFDTLYINGAFPNAIQKVDGGASNALDEVDRIIDGTAGDITSVTVRGWAGFNAPIVSFGYIIDDGEPVYNASFTKPTEAGVIAAGGEYASRFEIIVPVGDITDNSVICGVVLLESGYVAKLTMEGKSTEFNYVTTIEDPAEDIIIDLAGKNTENGEFKLANSIGVVSYKELVKAARSTFMYPVVTTTTNDAAWPYIQLKQAIDPSKNPYGLLIMRSEGGGHIAGYIASQGNARLMMDIAKTEGLGFYTFDSVALEEGDTVTFPVFNAPTTTTWYEIAFFTSEESRAQYIENYIEPVNVNPEPEKHIVNVYDSITNTPDCWLGNGEGKDISKSVEFNATDSFTGIVFPIYWAGVSANGTNPKATITIYDEDGNVVATSSMDIDGDNPNGAEFVFEEAIPAGQYKMTVSIESSSTYLVFTQVKDAAFDETFVKFESTSFGFGVNFSTEDGTFAELEVKPDEPEMKDPVDFNDDSVTSVNISFDTFYVNGQPLVDGGASSWIDDNMADRVLDGTNGDIESITIRGWVGFDKAIAKFGYVIGDAAPVFGDFAQTTEAGVLGAGGEYASRFAIDIPLAGVAENSVIVACVMLEDGSVVLLNSPACNTTINYQVVANPATADASIVVFMVAAAALVVTLLLRKKEQF